MESGAPDAELAPGVQAACEAFLKDAVSQNLKPPSIYKYKRLFRQLEDFAKSNGLVFISDFNLNWTRLFRQSWTNTGHAAYRKLGYLRAFFLFAAESGWLKENYARKLKPPKIPKGQVQPFTREQHAAILDAIPRYPDKKTQPRLRALVLLLRYSGLRIADAATISKDKIRDGKLMIRTAKTGATVYIPLPPVVLEALEEIPGETPFWSGKSKPHTVASVYQESLKKLFVLAGVPDGHAHRYRHTFAIELLIAGVPMERVSVLLGHSSVKTTEMHYAAWSKARQKQAEADVPRTWDAEATVTLAARQN